MPNRRPANNAHGGFRDCRKTHASAKVSIIRVRTEGRVVPPPLRRYESPLAMSHGMTSALSRRDGAVLEKTDRPVPGA